MKDPVALNVKFVVVVASHIVAALPYNPMKAFDIFRVLAVEPEILALATSNCDVTVRDPPVKERAAASAAMLFIDVVPPLIEIAE